MEKTTTSRKDFNGDISKIEEVTTSDLDQSFQQLGRLGNYRVMKWVKPIEKADWDDSSLTLAGMVNFIQVRKDQILARKDEAHIMVSSKRSSITLVIGEHGGQRVEGGTYVPSVVLTGTNTFTEDQKTVAAIMAGNHRPHELALKLRELPHLFSDEASWADAVKKLRSLNLMVSKAIKDTSNEDTGEQEKAIKLVIDSGTVEVTWNWRYAIYEGTDPVEVPVRVLYEADENMSGVFARVFNPRKVQQERKALEDMLASTVADIKAVLGDNLPIIRING
jgi:hypothetical protein